MKRTPLKRYTPLTSTVGFKRSTMPKVASKTKKARKPKLKTLKRKLKDVFNPYIRARDKWICISCGKYEKPGNAGHYKPDGACGAEYVFSEFNVNHQCVHCNMTLNGNQVEYRYALVKKIGEAAVLDIDMNYHKPSPQYPYEEKIAYYTAKLAEYA